MSLFAGIINRRGRSLPESVCSSLARSISRNPIDEVISFRYASAYFAKIDIGAFGEPGFVEDEHGALSLLTGEPLLSSNSAQDSNRQEELRILHDQALLNNWDALKRADGTFCFVHYQARTGSLMLIADKCAVRPLYFWIRDEVVIFASALRILEACPLVPKKMNLRGITEIVALGSTLDDRTPYVDIHRITPGQVITVNEEKISHHIYWRWDQIATSNEGEETRLKAAHQAFQKLVSRRVRRERSTAAFLSGGLDSRLIVAALRQKEIEVHTVNFALTGTQDQFLGDEFAKQVGSIHQSIPREAGDSVPDYSALMASALNSFDHDCERPRVVWSGEGGSTTLGFVRFTESIVDSMRRGQVDSVIDVFMRDEVTQVPARLFRSGVLDNAMEMVRQGVRDALARFDAEDPAWNLYLFLALNDQSRKLTRHFENLDLHRLEFQLPFFDGALIESVLATPIDWLLRHKFYVKLLPYFGAAAAGVPWQSYPGHQQCSLEIPANLIYQWNEEYQAREHAVKRRRMADRAARLVNRVDFPKSILDRRKLRLAGLIHLTGWRDYQYAIEAAETFCRYAEIAGGQFRPSPS